MDTRRRIEAVKARLRELQLDERRAEAVGPPCTQCRYWKPASVSARQKDEFCDHIASVQRAFDITRGQFVEKPVVTIQKARSDEGLCGPEAVLFEKSGATVATEVAGSAATFAKGLILFFAVAGLLSLVELFT